MLALTTLFLLGLIIGSFLNVVVLRSESGETLEGRSHCPHCKALIHWYDNIPLFSFLMLGGRCRACSASISWQYPLVELGTGLGFVLVGTQYSLDIGGVSLEQILSIAALLFTVSVLVAIVVSDLRTMEIPLLLLWLSVGGALLTTVIIPLLFHFEIGTLWGSWWQQHLLSGVLAASFFALLVFGSRETWMGRGDIWLAGAIGLLVGIKNLLFTLTLSFLVGALVGLLLLFLRRKQLKSQIPFAPFLVLGYFLVILLEWLNPWWLAFLVLPIE